MYKMIANNTSFLPTKILIIGTMGSGKTTVTQIISQKTGFPCHSIDQCRREYGDGTVSGEYLAQTSFMKACSSAIGTVLEFSGCGDHYEWVGTALSESQIPVYVVWLDVPLSLCRRRIQNRENQVPFPIPWGDPVQSVFVMNLAIEETWKTFWSQKETFHPSRLFFDEHHSPEGIADTIITLVRSQINAG